MQEETPVTGQSSSSHKGETRGEARRHPRETKSGITPTANKTITFEEQPVNRRLVGKTIRDDTTLLSADVNLLETMSTLLQDERACTLAVNDLEAEESVKMRSILDEPIGVKPERQNDLSALKEKSVGTVNRNFAAGHSVMQTRDEMK